MRAEPKGDNKPRRHNLLQRIVGVPLVKLGINNAFRLEDAFKRARSQFARRRGWLETIEPFTGYGNTEWIRVFARVQMAPPAERRMTGWQLSTLLRLGRRTREKSVRGWRSFVRPTIVDGYATVRVNGESFEVRGDRGGVIDVTIPTSLAPGWHQVEIESVDGQTAQATVTVIGEHQRVGIISDVDDTAMVTALPRPLLAAWNTFVLDEHARVAVPGMNVLYQRLVRHYNAPTLYLSTGSWNVVPMLARFLGRNLYPAGPMLLTDWGPTPKRLFRSGTEHKRQSLRRLVAEFPEMQWILIGDDGQHDAPIFGEFVREYPDAVLAVVIRQLSNTESVLAGGRAASTARWSARSPVPWVFGPDGSVLTQRLAARGLLDGDEAASNLERLSETLATVQFAQTFPPAEPDPGASA